jgi:Uma2 family endonuclease
MNLKPPPPFHPPPLYPESDGKPLADNTKQARWIVVLFDNLLALFHTAADVFIAADLLWYAVEGEPAQCTAPDVLVVFGRPKGDRGSYRQWEEDNVPVTVAFEVLSPGNTHAEMIEKQTFYEGHGVEEYYLYDPDNNLLTIYIRKGDMLRRVQSPHGFSSPRLGIRFDLSGPEMKVLYPDGSPFLTFEELSVARKEAVRQRDDATVRLRRLAELSRKARLGQTSPEELQELERLEGEAGSAG